MKRSILPAIMLIFAAAAVAFAKTVIEVETPKELKPTGTLASCSYKPTQSEKEFLQKVGPQELKTGSFMQEYSIHHKKDTYVSWFGIVRGITKDSSSGQYHLLVEQKYFDGITDCHIMLVSVSGSGDFQADVEADSVGSIPMLSLVKVYGKVIGEVENRPKVAAEYIRVWPWMAFTLTDLGPADHGNPQWRKLCKRCQSGKVYNPYPDREYYLDVLGDPAKFASPEQPEAAKKPE